MNRTFSAVIVLTLAVILFPASPCAYAQATRTWVSGVGDDANPCSRTAPCKTFAGAISKTAAGGAIDALDPGGFGVVTITKSISIEGDGQLAGVLSSGTNGVVINAAATDVVVLRNLVIDGGGTGTNGVRFIAGGALHVENCEIKGFLQKGIDFEPSGTSQLFVNNTGIVNNKGSLAGGILVQPTGSGVAMASINNVRLEYNLFGVRAAAGSAVTVNHSVAVGNSANGILAISSTASAVITVVNSIISNNGANGIRADGAGAVVRIVDNTITNNIANGIWATASGQILSFGTNNIAGNGTDGNPTSSLIPR
jgi:hypothetical protein